MKQIFVCFCLYLCLFKGYSKPLSVDTVIYAIDCGSSRSYLTPDGFTYQADDQAYGSSRVADYTQQEIFKRGIKFALDPVVFTSERHGEQFHYELLLEGAGHYTLILQFIELWFGTKEERVFDILLGDTIVRQDFSILENIPERAFAHNEYIVFKLENGQIITDTGLVCINAYSQEQNKVKVEFRQGKRDLPKIDGLILVRGPLADSNYEEHQKFIQNWDQYEAEQNRIKEEEAASLRVASDIQAIDIEQDESEGLISLLFSWVGLVIYTIIGLFLFALFMTENKKKKKPTTKKTKTQNTVTETNPVTDNNKTKKQKQ